MSSWKIVLPCTRTEAEAAQVDAEALAELDPLPVLLTSERIEDDPTSWQLEAYFDGKPDNAAIAAVRSLVPSAGAGRIVPQRIKDQDWVTLSQAGIEPVHAGRFYIHTGTNRGTVPHGAHPLQIEASRAFGTGQHHTTTGCLMALDALKRHGLVARNLLDLGTGTGLLAFAALHLWPRAHATASDIDPASIDVTADNAVLNGVALGSGLGALAVVAAPGMEHLLLIESGPYDLIVANILAGPLIDLAPAVVASLAERGTLVLAGLLDGQAGAVVRAYRRQGVRLVGRIQRDQWPTLILRKRARHGWRRPVRDRSAHGETPGYGSW